MTIFYSTHILEDAEKVCDRIGLLHGGKVVIEGATGDILRSRSTHRHFLRTTGSVEDAEAVIKTLRAIKGYRKQKDGFELELNGDKPFTLFKALHDKGLEVTAFYETAKSLEDVFMEVTGNENTDEV